MTMTHAPQRPPSRFGGRRTWAGAIAGAALLVLTTTGVGTRSTRARHGVAILGAPTARQSVQSEAGPPVETLARLEPPELSVSDLPAAPAENIAAPPRPADASARAHCRPPFAFDVKTGKKRWKVECL